MNKFFDKCRLPLAIAISFPFWAPLAVFAIIVIILLIVTVGIFMIFGYDFED